MAHWHYNDPRLRLMYENALEALDAGDLTRAENCFKVVVMMQDQTVPAREEVDEDVHIRCWDERDIQWAAQRLALSDSPAAIVGFVCDYRVRALFALGRLEVENHNFQKAIEYLDQALRYWPEQPDCLCEKAIALKALKRDREALVCYQQVIEERSEANPLIRAVALRGKAVALIDLNELDQAEECLRASLELDPYSEVAQNELTYISQLRSGFGAVTTSPMIISPERKRICSICGRTIGNQESFLTSISGNSTICLDCTSQKNADEKFFFHLAPQKREEENP